MRGIEDLKKECEKVLGKAVVSPTNFDELNLNIKKSTGRNVSVSTLKRLWGYVHYPHRPSREILSILSVYAGYRDWHDFSSAEAIINSSDNRRLRTLFSSSSGNISPILLTTKKFINFALGCKSASTYIEGNVMTKGV